MATQEERITALERATAEYRPVLQNITYELTMVKGLGIVPEILVNRVAEDKQTEVDGMLGRDTNL